MRRATRTVAALGLAMNLGCVEPALQARARAFEIPREGPLPPLGVHGVIVRRDPGGDALPDAPMAVILTLPVDPATATADALRLVDQDGQPIPGVTRWVDPQLAIFQPSSALPPGRELRLQLLTPLRARSGGEALSPRDLATVTSRPLRSLEARLDGAPFYPVSSIPVRFERALPPEDLLAHARLTVSKDPAAIPFAVAARPDGSLLVTPARPFPPGETVRLGWTEGARARTSVGFVRFEPFEQRVAAGLHVVKVGDDALGRCVLQSAKAPPTRLFHCEDRTGVTAPGYAERKAVLVTGTVRLSLSAPISEAEVTAHVHVGTWSHVRLAEGANGSDHRLIVAGYVESGPHLRILVTLDADLTDVFGQRLGAEDRLVLERWTD